MTAKKLLMIVWVSPKVSPGTVHEHINNIISMSGNNIDTYNTYDRYLSKNGQEKKSTYFSDKVPLSQYDGLIVHNTVAYNPANVYRLSKRFDTPIEKFTGLKILLKQDELVYTNLTKQLLKDWGFHLLLTCVPVKDIDTIYPIKDFPQLTKLHVLTGYITDCMRSYHFSQRDNRPIDISYRGMKLPYHFGSLAHEKYQIGENFKSICSSRGLVFDISSRLKDRIYGNNWINFLSRSKATLAVESGGSIYDWDGSVAKEVKSYLFWHWWPTYHDIYQKILKNHEGPLIYNAISPRHFEAAATKTVLIMHEGEYGDIFKPDEHYIPVKKDYSNIEAVMHKFEDQSYREYLTENAYKDIIMNPVYSYENFVNTFDQAIEKLS